jgi:hypothetical protein
MQPWEDERMSEEEKALRDQFAAAAMPALMAERVPFEKNQISYQNLAHNAYDIAEAMLTERAKRKAK